MSSTRRTESSPPLVWYHRADIPMRIALKFARAAHELVPSRPPMHDVVCFCCQQAAEKYLKAILNEHGRAIPRTHDLEDILSLLLAFHLDLGALRRGLKFLIQFAVEVRYPGFHATKRQAVSALRWAGRVRDACRTVLRIRPARPRRTP